MVDIVGMLIDKALPATLAMDNGDPIQIVWIDDLLQSNNEVLPLGVIRKSGVRTLAQRLRLDHALATTVVAEGIVFVSGTTTYQVTERDIVTLTSITGTLSGAPHTFVQGTDYEKFQSPGYETYDAVKWIDGGDEPDDATSFTVNYTRRVLDERNVNYSEITYELMLKVPDLAVAQKGSTIARAGPVLLDEMLIALDVYLSYKRGMALDAAKGISLCGHDVMGMMSAHTGEGFARGVIHLQVHYRNAYVGVRTKTIGSVGTEIEAEPG